MLMLHKTLSQILNTHLFRSFHWSAFSRIGVSISGWTEWKETPNPSTSPRPLRLSLHHRLLISIRKVLHIKRPRHVHACFSAAGTSISHFRRISKSWTNILFKTVLLCVSANRKSFPCKLHQIALPQDANCVCLQYVYVAFLCLLVSQHFPHSLNLTTSWTLSMSYIWFSCPHFTPKVPLWIVRKVLGTFLTQCYVIYVYLCAMVAVLAMVIEWKPHTLRYPRWLVGGNQPRFRVTCCESIWVDFRDYLRLWRLQKLRFSFTKGPQLSIAYFNYPSYHIISIISIISIRNRDEDDWWSKMCATMCNTYQHMDSCSCHDAFDVWSLFDSSNVGPSTEPAISELGWKK